MKKEELFNINIDIMTRIRRKFNTDIYLLDGIMGCNDIFTDKEYNSIREAHDYISNARDILERLTKQKD